MENQTLAFAERTLRDHLALLPEGWGRNFEIATGLSGGGDYSYRVRDGKARFTGSLEKSRGSWAFFIPSMR